MDEFIDKKRVVKNTILLYVRMGVMMLVSLYTSRIILAALGVEDYGIYNVVGGVVAMFSMVSMALNVAVRRFINIEMAKKDGDLHGMLQTSIVAMFLLVLMLFLLMETAGVWLVNNKLVIPEDRLVAANIAFQLSVFTFMIRLVAIPFNALIVAHEKMGIYAYLSIAEVMATLGISLIIANSETDRLILYSALLGVISLGVSFFYFAYCQNRITRIVTLKRCNKAGLKSIYSYSSWSLFGAVGAMLSSQGVNMIFNMFFGVVVNAAMGISNQVSNAFAGFVRNFQTAFDPQLTKTYAAEGLSENTFEFVCLASRISLILTIIIGFPLLSNISYILHIWLITVPQYAEAFCVVAVITMIIDGCAGALYILVYAKGDVRIYQLWLTLIQFLYFILVYILCRMGYNPLVAIVFNVASYAFMFVARLFILKGKMGFPVLSYVKKVLIPLIFPLGILLFVYDITNNRISISPVIRIIFHVVCALIVVCFIYVTKAERKQVLYLVKQKLSH